MASFSENKSWKSFQTKLYGFGAAVVITGALFKLQHWPGASLMLVVGMSVEAVIFFISAFDPLPHPEPHWEIVYPELQDGYPWEVEIPEQKHGSSRAQVIGGVVSAGALPATGGASALPPQVVQAPAPQPSQGGAVVGNLDLSGVDASHLTSGLNKLSKSVEKLNTLSETAVVAGTFTEKMQQASQTLSNFAQSYDSSSQVLSESMLMLSDTYQGVAKNISDSGKNLSEEVNKTGKKMTEVMTTAADGFNKVVADSGKQVGEEVSKMGKQLANVVGGAADGVAKVVADSGKLAGEEIAKTGKQMAEVVGNATEIFASTFTVIDQHIKTSVETLKQGSGSYNKQIESLNKNMTALNTIYELQAKEVSKYHQNSAVMGQQLDKFVGELKEAAEANQALHQGVAKLNQSIGELNNIYGSMLSAVQLAAKKK